jgi:hypothetical protein
MAASANRPCFLGPPAGRVFFGKNGVDSCDGEDIISPTLTCRFALTRPWDSKWPLARPIPGTPRPPVRDASLPRSRRGPSRRPRRPAPPAPAGCGRPNDPLDAPLHHQLNRPPIADRLRPPPARPTGIVVRPRTVHGPLVYCRPGHPGQGRPRYSPRRAGVGAARAAPCDPAGRTSGVSSVRDASGLRGGPRGPTWMSAAWAVFISAPGRRPAWNPNRPALILI